MSKRFFFLEGRLARRPPLPNADEMRSREDTTEAALIYSALKRNGSRKGGNRIDLQIGCRLQAAVAKSVYLGLYHSTVANVANVPT